MSSLTLLSHLQDSKVVRVFVPLKNGDRKRLDGVAKVVNDTLVEVSFLPDQLPVSDIEILQKALISLDTGDGTLSLNCSIEKIVSDEKLLLMATESISHEQKREWFRVDGNFAVKYWPVTEKGAPSGDTATACVSPSKSACRCEPGYAWRSRCLSTARKSPASVASCV